ncbi:hypothetical protein ACFW04_003706 [Cataglyphis niger]
MQNKSSKVIDPPPFSSSSEDFSNLSSAHSKSYPPHYNPHSYSFFPSFTSPFISYANAANNFSPRLKSQSASPRNLKSNSIPFSLPEQTKLLSNSIRSHKYFRPNVSFSSPPSPIPVSSFNSPINLISSSNLTTFHDACFLLSFFLLNRPLGFLLLIGLMLSQQLFKLFTPFLLIRQMIPLPSLQITNSCIREDFSLFQWNCHGILNKIETLELIDNQYDVLAFSETSIKHSISFMKINSTFNLNDVLETVGVKISSINNTFIYIYSIYHFSFFPINDGTPTFIFYSSRSSSVIDLTFVSSNFTAFCHWKLLDDTLDSDHISSIITISHQIRSRSFFSHNLHTLIQEAATKRILRKSKRIRWGSYCKTLTSFTSISTLWRNIKRFKNRYLNSVNFSSTSNYGVSPTIENLISSISSSSCLHKLPASCFDSNHEYLCRTFVDPFRLEELFYVISPLKKKKSFPGFDQIDYNMLSNHPDILEKLILFRLDWWLERFERLPSFQFGFRKYRSKLTDENYSYKGVPQGSLLSPIFFNIYVAKLHKHIGEECDLKNQLIKLLGFFLEKFLEKFTVSPSKSSLVIFTKKHIHPSAYSIKLHFSTIQSVPSCKFLVHLDFRLSGKDHIQNLSTRNSKLLNIFKVLLYGCIDFSFYNYILMDILEKNQYRAIRLCLGLRRTTPTNILLAEAEEVP